MPLSQSSEHKKPDFVLERGQNQGKIAVSDTKMPILCSKCLKMGVSEGKRFFVKFRAVKLSKFGRF